MYQPDASASEHISQQQSAVLKPAYVEEMSHTTTDLVVACLITPTQGDLRQCASIAQLVAVQPAACHCARAAANPRKQGDHPSSCVSDLDRICGPGQRKVAKQQHRLVLVNQLIASNHHSARSRAIP